MRHLKRYFNGVEVGSVCTGTISYFNLSTKLLLQRNIITKRDVRVDVGRSGPSHVEQYVFLGFSEEDELEDAPVFH